MISTDSYADNNPSLEALNILLPFLKSFGILRRQVRQFNRSIPLLDLSTIILISQASIADIHENDLKELALYWNVGGSVKLATTAMDKRPTKAKASASMRPEILLQLLVNKAMGFKPKGESLSKRLIQSPSIGPIDLWQPSPVLSSANLVDANGRSTKPIRNYCGLPSTANLSTVDTLVSDCRLPMLSAIYRRDFGQTSPDPNHANMGHSRSSGDLNDTDDSLGKRYINGEEKLNGQVDAQRKVARSLLTMAQNSAMTHLYVTKGGVDAVFRLINDTHDLTVRFKLVCI